MKTDYTVLTIAELAGIGFTSLLVTIAFLEKGLLTPVGFILAITFLLTTILSFVLSEIKNRDMYYLLRFIQLFTSVNLLVFSAFSVLNLGSVLVNVKHPLAYVPLLAGVLLSALVITAVPALRLLEIDLFE